jgi:hypothetical protein
VKIKIKQCEIQEKDGVKVLWLLNRLKCRIVVKQAIRDKTFLKHKDNIWE